MTGSTLPPCRECAVGACGNCDGRTWYTAGDVYAPCPCSHLAQLAAIEAAEHADDGSCCDPEDLVVVPPPCPECGGRSVSPAYPTVGHAPGCKVAMVLYELVLGMQVRSPASMVTVTAAF